MVCNALTYIGKNTFYRIFTRFGKAFLLVLAHIKPKEVEPLSYMSNLRFLFGEFQPSVGKKLADERFNFSFEIFAIATGNHKIVGIADEVYFKWVTVWFVMSMEVDNFLQPIESHVGHGSARQSYVDWTLRSNQDHRPISLLATGQLPCLLDAGLLDVCGLLLELINERLHVDNGTCNLGIVALRTNCIRFT